MWLGIARRLTESPQTAPHRKKVLVFFGFIQLFKSCQLSQLKFTWCVFPAGWVAGNQLNVTFFGLLSAWGVSAVCLPWRMLLFLFDHRTVTEEGWGAMRRRYVSAGCGIKSWPVIIIENRIAKKRDSWSNSVVEEPGAWGVAKRGKSGENLSNCTWSKSIAKFFFEDTPLAQWLEKECGTNRSMRNSLMQGCSTQHRAMTMQIKHIIILFFIIKPTQNT